MIGFAVVMVAVGRARDVHPLMWAVAAMFVVYFAVDWLSAHVF